MRTHLINAVVGRVAPRALSRNLEKGWLSLKIGRLGARGATRPTVYDMASSKLCRAGMCALLVLWLVPAVAGGWTNGPPEIAFSRILRGWTNYSTAFNATHDTGAQGDYATVASFYTPAESVRPLEYGAIFVWIGSGNPPPGFASFDYRVFIWSSLGAFIQDPRQGDVATFHFDAPTGGSTTVPDTTTRGGRPAFELRFTLTNSPMILSNGHTYLIGVAARADTQRDGELFVPTASHDGPSDVQAGDLVVGGWLYLVNAGGSTIYSGQLATELVVQPIIQLPELRIERINHTVRLTWPASAPGFVLEYSFNISPGTEWFPVEAKPEEANGFKQVVLAISFTRQWFRLRR